MYYLQENFQISNLKSNVKCNVSIKIKAFIEHKRNIFLTLRDLPNALFSFITFLNIFYRLAFFYFFLNFLHQKSNNIILQISDNVTQYKHLEVNI